MCRESKRPSDEFLAHLLADFRSTSVVNATELSVVQFPTAGDLTAARKGSSNSETSYPANAGYGSRWSVSNSRPIFMTSRDFDFETAIWDFRFYESMKSLLSPVDIASKERISGIPGPEAASYN